MAAKLVAEEGTLKGLVLSLEDSDQWIIGRDPDACQLIIEDPVASRRHLICRNTSEGIILENLSTTNPVQVNSESVNEPRLLSNGDLVKIGSGTFRFYSESEAQVINDMTEAPLQKEELPVSKSPEEEINGEEEENHEEEPFVNEEEVEITANEEPDEEADNTEDANDIEVKEASIERAGGEEEEPQDEAIAEQMPEEEAANEKPEEEAADEEPEEEAVDEEEPRSDSIFDEEIDENEQILANINFDLLETGRWLLKVISGPNNGAEFAMQPGSTYMIGTDPNSCDIIFHDTSVSRQHARITVEGEDKLFIEDLKSKNGTLIDSNPLEGRQPLQPNTVVTLGTTSFVVFDREGEMQTIISPILPSIVKALQDRESEDKQRKRDAGNETPPESTAVPEEIVLPKEKDKSQMTGFILIAMVVGIFVVVGIGAATLFTERTVETTKDYNAQTLIGDALAPFKGVRYSFNDNTGTLLMVGHVLTENSKKQLLYNLQGMKFIKRIDDNGVVIDELVWQEYNSMLAKNPNWRGITIQAPAAGQFVLTGNLKDHSEIEKLMDYLSVNFPYLDQLENRVVVEEDVINTAQSMLRNHNINNLRIEMSGGDLIVKGGIAKGKEDVFDTLIEDFKSIPGVRNVQDFVTEVEAERSMINISDRYEVSGVSSSGGANMSAVIDGKILTRGDTLDGMRITSIKSNAIFLEKDGVKYRIDLK